MLAVVEQVLMVVQEQQVD